MKVTATQKKISGIILIMLMLVTSILFIDHQIYAAEPNTSETIDGSYTIGVGETLTLNASKQQTEWKSGNTRVATVASDGKVVGLRSGTAIIRMTVSDPSKYKKQDKYPKGTVLRLYSRQTKTVKRYKVTVKKTYEDLNPEKPSNPTDVDDYYWDNSEHVLQVANTVKSQESMSEKDAQVFLKKRGFDNFEITCENSMTGEYFSARSIGDSVSSERHPMYETYYVAKNGNYWSIFIVDGSVYANPVSFNMESTLGAPVLFSENKVLTSYDDGSNQFYITIPKEEAVIVKVVDQIDAETLDHFTIGEIARYENE